MLPLHVLSLALSESFYDWLPWIIAGAILVLGLIVYGRRDLARLRPRRIWAISDVCFTEAIRKRVLWVTPLAIIGVIVVAQLSRPADAQDAIRQATKFCLFASGLLVAVTAIILACTNLPREIETRVIYTVVTKPTTRLEIVLGKVLGFARVSGSIILIMGIFTYGYLKIRSWSEMAQVRNELAALPEQSTVRPALEHYVQTGFLTTLSLDEPANLEILGRPPKSGDPTKWMKGAQGEYAVVSFTLDDDDRAILAEAAEHGTVFVTAAMRIEQHEPNADEAKLIKQMGLDRPRIDMSKVSPVFGPELPSTEPTTAAVAETPAIPPALLQVTLMDENRRAFNGVTEASAGEAVEFKPPDRPQDLWHAAIPLPSDNVKKLAGANKFYARIYAHSPVTEYGIDVSGNPLSLTIPTTGKPIVITDKAPAPAEFYSFPARRGMRLVGHIGGTGPVAVYHFSHADLGHSNSGKIPLQLRLTLERSGDLETGGSAYARVSIQAVNRDTGKTSPVMEFAPEQSQIRFLDMPADVLEGGNFDVLVRGLTGNMWLGVSRDSIAVVVSDQSFLLNLFKSLLLLWLLSLLVIIIAVFCSTFLSWPIAVVCTLLLLLGHWGVEQLGDALKPGASRNFAQDFQIRDPAVQDTLTKAMDNLSSMLRTVSNFLPDVGQFPVTEYIENGVSIPLARIGGALGVLFCYGVPLLVLSYVIMRNKEVAP